MATRAAGARIAVILVPRPMRNRNAVFGAQPGLDWLSGSDLASNRDTAELQFGSGTQDRRSRELPNAEREDYVQAR